MSDLSGIVKAYDIRGVVGEQLNADLVRDFGAAFALLVKLDVPTAVVIGHDMRESSPGLAAAFAEGVTSQGLDVINIGLASTDQLYFASGSLNLPGAMFTASHNPAQYNGIKLCRAGAAPVGQDSGLGEIRDTVSQGVPEFAGQRGTVTERDVLADYAAHLRQLVDLQAKVRETGADAGLAFDGDADRCFVVDERGEPVSPSAVTALVAVRELAKEPGATIIHNLITSQAVPEIVTEHGGKPVRTRVGHSFIKQEMAATGAIFGGEHSAHYYFRDFWKADTGMLAALHVLAALGEQDGPLSELTAQYSRYAASGEINSTVDDQVARQVAVKDAYAGRDGALVDELDGLTVRLDDGSWFNLRASNTEPLLRLNVEAPDEQAVRALTDEVLAIVRD